MRGVNLIGIIGFVLLFSGIAFGIFDAKFSDHWYDWVFGPLFWGAGGSLIIVWALGRFVVSDEQPSEKCVEYVEGVTPDRRRADRRCRQRRNPSAATAK
jgi:hypothetical protein